MNNEVWVVWESEGSYEDYHLSIAGIKHSEESANKLAKELDDYNNRDAPMDEDEFYKSYENMRLMDTESLLLMEDMDNWINDRYHEHHQCIVEKFEVTE